MKQQSTKSKWIREQGQKFYSHGCLSNQPYAVKDLEKLLSAAWDEGYKEGLGTGKKIYVNYVDWSEWGVSDEEAAEYFDEHYKEDIELAPSNHKG